LPKAAHQDVLLTRCKRPPHQHTSCLQRPAPAPLEAGAGERWVVHDGDAYDDLPQTTSRARLLRPSEVSPTSFAACFDESDRSVWLFTSIPRSRAVWPAGRRHRHSESAHAPGRSRSANGMPARSSTSTSRSCGRRPAARDDELGNTTHAGGRRRRRSAATAPAARGWEITLAALPMKTCRVVKTIAPTGW